MAHTSAPAPASATFAPYDRVQIVGLESRPELNGVVRSCVSTPVINSSARLRRASYCPRFLPTLP